MLVADGPRRGDRRKAGQSVGHHEAGSLTKGPNMKKTKPNEPAVSARTRPEPVIEESVSFSPEAISNRSSAETKVLKEMLDRDKKSYELRVLGNKRVGGSKRASNSVVPSSRGRLQNRVWRPRMAKRCCMLASESRRTSPRTINNSGIAGGIAILSSAQSARLTRRAGFHPEHPASSRPPDSGAYGRVSGALRCSFAELRRLRC